MKNIYVSCYVFHLHMNFYIADSTTTHSLSRCSCQFIIDILFFMMNLKLIFRIISRLKYYLHIIEKHLNCKLINALYQEVERTGKVNVPMYRRVEDNRGSKSCGIIYSYNYFKSQKSLSNSDESDFIVKNFRNI